MFTVLYLNVLMEKKPDDNLISHINHKKDDNRLCNLELITQQDKYEKSNIIEIMQPPKKIWRKNME